MSQVLPYPLHDGGRIDIYHRLLALKSLGHEVDLIAFYNPAIPLPDLSVLKTLCRSLHLVPWLRRKVSKLLGWRPYTLTSRENWWRLDEIVPLLQKHYALIIAESHHVLTVCQYLRQSIICDHFVLRVHNDEARFLWSVFKSSPKLSVLRFFFALEALRYFLYEHKLLGPHSHLDQLWHISNAECLRYQKKYPTLIHRFLPAGIKLSTMHSVPSTHKKRRVLFCGAFSSPNNLHAIRWYLKHVHCHLVERFSDYVFVLAGSSRGCGLNPIRHLTARESQIEIHDSPENMREVSSTCALFVNPMQKGAGVKVKTVEAVLAGLPIVSTSVGNEGTGLVSPSQIRVADAPTSFLTQVIELLNSSEQRAQLVRSAQELLIKDYDQVHALENVMATLKAEGLV